jgi:hypothetical protein
MSSRISNIEEAVADEPRSGYSRTVFQYQEQWSKKPKKRDRLK